MKELEHIHNKAIFDACNEALNHFRPYYSSIYVFNYFHNLRCRNSISMGKIYKKLKNRIHWALSEVDGE